jgi:hypothetical protein
MKNTSLHNFHIPVMGLGYTIDTPLKVAKFGISSVVSIIDDQLIEQMRIIYCRKEQELYEAISVKDLDHRAKRITAYLNLMNKIVSKQIAELKQQAFAYGNDIVKYFEMLPENSTLKSLYKAMVSASGEAKENLKEELRASIAPGKIDVNIMTKVDKANYDSDGNPLPSEYSDALTALKGYADSNISSSIVFSAGLNPRLFAYCSTFSCFYPDENGDLEKKIILKVSDFRSAMIQGKYLAKKGLWVSEFRIESGLNCGGHAFASNGQLLGPILEEFKSKKKELQEELYAMCQSYWKENNAFTWLKDAHIGITAQGGVGNAAEQEFLFNTYDLNSVGWGSPFLLVSEAVSIDKETQSKLAKAKPENFYLSHASPLGIPFNNFRDSTSIKLKEERTSKGRPGSPCYKKYLSANTEFTNKPICTASREFQHKKIIQIQASDFKESEKLIKINQVTEKECLCEGLAAGSLLSNNVTPPHKLKAVAICPGPNLAYFSGLHSLQDMVDHIYGRISIQNLIERPHVFIKEIQLNISYLKKQVAEFTEKELEKKSSYINTFKTNLSEGIDYYNGIIQTISSESKSLVQQTYEQFEHLKSEIDGIGRVQIAFSLV